MGCSTRIGICYPDMLCTKCHTSGFPNPKGSGGWNYCPHCGIKLVENPDTLKWMEKKK